MFPLSHWGLPGVSVSKESAYNVGDLGLIPGLERCLGEGDGYPPVFLPGQFHEQRSLAGYSSWCCKESDTIEKLTSLFSKEQVSFNFATTVTIHSDFGAQGKKICHCFYFFSVCHEVMGLDFLILVF